MYFVYIFYKKNSMRLKNFLSKGWSVHEGGSTLRSATPVGVVMCEAEVGA